MEYDSVKCTRATLSDLLPFEDNLDHLNLDGTPYMWGLLGKWDVVDDLDHGKVLKGTYRGPNEPRALRGESEWSHYRLEANMKIDAGADAGLVFRVLPASGDYQCYICYLKDNGNGTGELGIAARYASIWWPLDDVDLAGSPANQWKAVAVEVTNVYNSGWWCQMKYYLNGALQHTATVQNPLYPAGMIGLWVRQGSASFDNVTVSPLP